jgi:hypothetical protein
VQIVSSTDSRILGLLAPSKAKVAPTDDELDSEIEEKDAARDLRG